MLIAFAFSFIAILLIYGNYKLLRHPKALLVFMVMSVLLAILGIYLLLTMKAENPYILMPLMNPMVALLFLQLARLLFHRITGQEIILYLGGFLPKKFEERFVSRLEKTITLLITVLALAIPYLVVMGVGHRA